MIFEPRSLTLHFSEANKGVWEILQSLTPKHQQAMIIDALTEYLKEYKAPEEDSGVSWDLKSLFVTEENNNQGNQDESSLHKASSTPSASAHQEIVSLDPTGIPPLKHLFEMLGEEEDEDVIELLIHTPQKRDKEFLLAAEGIQNYGYPSEKLDPLVSLENETLQVSKRGPSSLDEPEIDSQQGRGLNFVLQHVIGEEKDEEVLRFFGAGNSTKKEGQVTGL